MRMGIIVAGSTSAFIQCQRLWKACDGDVIVQDNGVGDFTIHASIMATGSQTGAAEGDPNDIDGRFYVENYWSGSIRGELTVYGGIIQNWRGAVGTGGGGGTGFMSATSRIISTIFGTARGMRKGPQELRCSVYRSTLTNGLNGRVVLRGSSGAQRTKKRSAAL